MRRLTIEGLSSSGARATSWRNKWNSTPLGQQWTTTTVEATSVAAETMSSPPTERQRRQRRRLRRLKHQKKSQAFAWPVVVTVVGCDKRNHKLGTEASGIRKSVGRSGVGKIATKKQPPEVLPEVCFKKEAPIASIIYAGEEKISRNDFTIGNESDGDDSDGNEFVHLNTMLVNGQSQWRQTRAGRMARLSPKQEDNNNEQVNSGREEANRLRSESGCELAIGSDDSAALEKDSLESWTGCDCRATVNSAQRIVVGSREETEARCFGNENETRSRTRSSDQQIANDSNDVMEFASYRAANLYATTTTTTTTISHSIQFHDRRKDENLPSKYRKLFRVEGGKSFPKDDEQMVSTVRPLNKLSFFKQKHDQQKQQKSCNSFKNVKQRRLFEQLASLVYIVLIYIFITSSTQIQVSRLVHASGGYWPQRKSQTHSSATEAPKDRQQVSSSSSSPVSRQLMIGQHYSNFSSIVPYSIVQDSDYGQTQEDQLMEEEQEQLPLDQLLSGQLMSMSLGNNRNAFERSQLQQHPSNQLQTQVITDASRSDNSEANSRASLLNSNRLVLPQMQQIKSRFNQGCVGGTKCQFFAFCWMSGGSLGASCGLLMTCCVTPSRQEIQPGFYGPVVNDPYCGRSTSKINRIVGGTDASFGQFPWQAFVQVGGSRCGGALISSRHVVTAGHCVARSQHSPSSIKVTLGDYILNSDIESIPHEVFSVVEVLLHPNFRFTPQADRYDVAVLELDRTASYKDNIKPICLPQKDAAFVGRVAYVAGWGALQAGSKLRPKVLQHVAVPVIENHVCESWHRRKGIDIRIYDEMMCAGYELGQRDACQGDSGGPLMLNQFGVWYLVGIVSAGYSCAKQYQPGIYHRVSSSSDWISSNIYQQGASK